jgi:hypothetical protein
MLATLADRQALHAIDLGRVINALFANHRTDMARAREMRLLAA